MLASMSKLGRHQRTIQLPEEEPWVIPPQPLPEKQRADPERRPASAPEKQQTPVPAAPFRP
jgi:hypothetical protein